MLICITPMHIVIFAHKYSNEVINQKESNSCVFASLHMHILRSCVGFIIARCYIIIQARSQTFVCVCVCVCVWGGGGGGQIGQIWGPFMITRGLSCDRVEFGHFGGGQMTPLTAPPGYGPVSYY